MERACLEVAESPPGRWTSSGWHRNRVCRFPPIREVPRVRSTKSAFGGRDVARDARAQGGAGEALRPYRHWCLTRSTQQAWAGARHTMSARAAAYILAEHFQISCASRTCRRLPAVQAPTSRLKNICGGRAHPCSDCPAEQARRARGENARPQRCRGGDRNRPATRPCELLQKAGRGGACMRPSREMEGYPHAEVYECNRPTSSNASGRWRYWTPSRVGICRPGRARGARPGLDPQSKLQERVVQTGAVRHPPADCAPHHPGFMWSIGLTRKRRAAGGAAADRSASSPSSGTSRTPTQGRITSNPGPM